METLAFPFPPWPDLLDPLLELILERLPISDYVRFAAVCRRWRSVQTFHRRRHSPSPPPMLRLPWLVRTKSDRGTLSFYSPFEDRSFAVPLPFSPRYLDPFARGWLLSSDSLGNNTLFNPISGSTIDLPPLVVNSVRPLPGCARAISPPPNYIVSVVASSTIFLFRRFDPAWIELKFPTQVQTLKRVVTCGGKHYRLCSERTWHHQFYSFDLLVVDALATPPTFQYFEMMGWSQMATETGCKHGAIFFVEFDDEPLLVVEIVKDFTRVTVGFEVFRADLSRKMWVRVESIGDNRVLMLHQSWSLSLLAADIRSRGNCIYFSSRLRLESNTGEAWKEFDIGTGNMTDLLLPNASQIEKYRQRLFLPNLC